jgi:riboflavin synthase alpha subunit
MYRPNLDVLRLITSSNGGHIINCEVESLGTIKKIKKKNQTKIWVFFSTMTST